MTAPTFYANEIKLTDTGLDVILDGYIKTQGRPAQQCRLCLTPQVAELLRRQLGQLEGLKRFWTEEGKTETS